MRTRTLGDAASFPSGMAWVADLQLWEGTPLLMHWTNGVDHVLMHWIGPSEWLVFALDAAGLAALLAREATVRRLFDVAPRYWRFAGDADGNYAPPVEISLAEIDAAVLPTDLPLSDELSPAGWGHVPVI